MQVPHRQAELLQCLKELVIWTSLALPWRPAQALDAQKL